MGASHRRLIRYISSSSYEAAEQRLDTKRLDGRFIRMGYRLDALLGLHTLYTPLIT